MIRASPTRRLPPRASLAARYESVMQIYTVHLKRFDPLADFVLVKEGFSWPGFFLSALWALWHRLWWAALMLAAANLAVSLLSSMPDLNPFAQAAMSLGFAAAVGFIANDLRRWTLKRSGYVIEAVVSGQSLEDAERRFLDGSPELLITPAAKARS